MKTTEMNIINNTQAAEVAAKEAAAKAAKEKEILDAVQKGNVLDMMKDVEEGIASFVTDDNDNIVGFGYHAHAKGMNAVKQVGSTLTVGSNEEERQQDEFDVKVFTKKYGSLMEGAEIMKIAVMLINAGLKPDKEIDHNGNRYFIIVESKKVIDQRGNTKVDLSEDETINGASDKLVLRLLETELEKLLK